MDTNDSRSVGELASSVGGVDFAVKVGGTSSLGAFARLVVESNEFKELRALGPDPQVERHVVHRLIRDCSESVRSAEPLKSDVAASTWLLLLAAWESDYLAAALSLATRMSNAWRTGALRRAIASSRGDQLTGVELLPIGHQR